MSVMSDLDLLVREGAVTQNDFIERGISPDRAKAFAEIVAETQWVRDLREPITVTVAERTNCNIECHCENHDYGNDPDGKAFAT